MIYIPTLFLWFIIQADDDEDDSPSQAVNLNSYQMKKNFAQGLMDVALFSANASQLRHVIDSPVRGPYFYISVSLISASLLTQALVGVGLVLNSRCNMEKESGVCKANKLNNSITAGVVIITLLNIFIPAFGITAPRLY